MSIGLTVGLTMIQSYTIIAEANGIAMGKSSTAPSPYAVWQVDNDGKGVSCGHYFVDREEAEWDLCARAFEWFEDNVNIHMIEDGKETSETRTVFDYRTIEDQPPGRDLIDGLRKIGIHMTAAAQLVDEMCAELDRLKAERRYLNVNNGNNND